MLSQFEIAGIDVDASIVMENGLCFHINGFNKNVVLSSSVCFGSILLLILFHISELKIWETKHFGMLLALPWKILRLVSTQMFVFFLQSAFAGHPRNPPGVPPDLQSGVKKCPNLFMLCGFGIRSKRVCFFLLFGGLQIPSVTPCNRPRSGCPRSR